MLVFSLLVKFLPFSPIPFKKLSCCLHHNGFFNTWWVYKFTFPNSSIKKLLTSLVLSPFYLALWWLSLVGLIWVNHLSIKLLVVDDQYFLKLFVSGFKHSVRTRHIMITFYLSASLRIDWLSAALPVRRVLFNAHRLQVRLSRPYSWDLVFNLFLRVKNTWVFSFLFFKISKVRLN